MNSIQRIKNRSLIVRILFWSGQIIGTVTVIPLLLFVGGNIFGELLEGLISFKEEYLLFIFFVFLLGILAGLIIGWFRSRAGSIIIIASSIAAGVAWGDERLLLLLPLVSGILVLFSTFQKNGKP